MMAMDRRSVLRGLAAAAAASVAIPRVSFAALPGAQRFVLVILRGGMDGLAAVPPYGDPDYRRLRADLAVPEPGAEGGVLPLDDRFGLHPALAPIHGLWRGGELQIVHAAATPYRERSHFDAQNVLENGGGSPSGIASGWLNRALGVLGGHELGLAVGPAAPLAMMGAVPVATWAPVQAAAPDDQLLATIDRLYAHDEAFHAALASARSVAGLMGAGAGDGMPEGAHMRLAPFFEGMARLLRAETGPRLATIDVTGWDTHAVQGSWKGRLAGALGLLADGLVTFRAAMGPAWSDTIVVAATEFGRTAAPNGTGGTDHGTAGAVLVLGGRLAGARIHTDWPGLARERLYQGRDLAPTTDTRSVFAAVLRDHFGVPERVIAAQILPQGVAARPIEGLVRA